MSAEKPNAERLPKSCIEYPRDSPIVQALERGHSNWAKGNCHEVGCGCITVYMWRELECLTAQPPLEKLRERIEALPRYRWTKKGVTEHPDGNWLNCEAVLAEFEKVNT